jgi:drug/metabolite transporter (DMT)-like permease
LSLAALLYALASSISWGTGDFISGVRSRTLGVLGVLVTAQVAGLVLAAAFVLGRLEPWPGPRMFLAVPAAVAGTVGLYGLFRGMAIGAISVVAPIAGVSAVIPVAFGVLGGDDLGLLQSLGIAAAIAGVALASRERDAAGASIAAGAGFGLLAALGFGLYYPPLHAAGEVDPYWAVLVFRCTSVLLATGALLLARAPLPPRRHVPILALAGVLDLGGNLLYALAAAEHGLVSVISVLASLYPIVTVALATILLHERPAPWQWVGVALTFTGIALIAAS